MFVRYRGARHGNNSYALGETRMLSRDGASTRVACRGYFTITGAALVALLFDSSLSAFGIASIN